MAVGEGCEIKRCFSKNENIRTYLYFEEVDTISKETLIQKRNRQVVEVMTLSRKDRSLGLESHAQMVSDGCQGVPPQ